MRGEKGIAKQFEQYVMLCCQSVFLKFVVGYWNAVYAVLDGHLLKHPSMYGYTLEVVIHCGPNYVFIQYWMKSASP